MRIRLMFPLLAYIVAVLCRLLSSDQYEFTSKQSSCVLDRDMDWGNELFLCHCSCVRALLLLFSRVKVSQYVSESFAMTKVCGAFLFVVFEILLLVFKMPLMG